MKQVFSDFSGSNIVANVLCDRKEILCYSHISIEQQKLRRQRDSQALISICKTMELARTIEQMGNLIYKSRIR